MSALSVIDKIIIGQSTQVEELKRLIDMVATAKSNVMILGETGSGKELVARALHAASGLKGDLVSVNCAAIPAELLESELFGHEKGSFTGADKARAGRFELADGGTLFLDEIGDMPLPLQAKLLRALESRTIQRVGSAKEIPVDFRLVCATHQNISHKIDSGDFRSDLFFRINVIPIQVPTLAERSVDIPTIAAFLLEQLANDAETKPPEFEPSAMTEMGRYPWPGNVRELRNVVERAFVMFAGRTVTAANVRENLLRMKVPDRAEEQDALWAASAELSGINVPSLETDDDSTASDTPLPHPSHYGDWFTYFDSIDLRSHLRDIEVVLIEAALEKYDGMVSHAAEALKLRRTTLIEKMKKLMIDKHSASADSQK